MGHDDATNRVEGRIKSENAATGTDL